MSKHSVGSQDQKLKIQEETLVKKVYETDNFYHMVLKNNTSSTKAGTIIDDQAESDDQVKNEEFKLKKVDLYLERKE